MKVEENIVITFTPEDIGRWLTAELKRQGLVFDGFDDTTTRLLLDLEEQSKKAGGLRAHAKRPPRVTRSGGLAFAIPADHGVTVLPAQPAPPLRRLRNLYMHYHDATNHCESSFAGHENWDLITCPDCLLSCPEPIALDRVRRALKDLIIVGRLGLSQDDGDHRSPTDTITDMSDAEVLDKWAKWREHQRERLAEQF